MAVPTDARSVAVPKRAPSLLAGCLLIVLGGCGGSKTTAEWIELSRSKDSAERARAISSLGQRGAVADTVVPVLVAALTDEDAFVRRDAAKGLGRIGPSASAAIPPLRSAAKDRNLHVRRAAIEALRKMAPGLPPE